MSHPVRHRILVTGIVQGVGFRPFVYTLAQRVGLAGFVLNDGGGVVIEAEGPEEALGHFASALRDEAPPLSRVEDVAVAGVAPLGDGEFVIARSEATADGIAALVPPDAATCDDCLRELRDPNDRRFGYPFINCTQCGPRFTIVRSVPYDRPNTTMAEFPLCPECLAEYEDPLDRRFHAEPVACPTCGPQLSMPVGEAAQMLRDGAILAVKGLGGYHLACDAGNEEAVARMRARKHREDKPFALMLDDPSQVAEVSSGESSLLRSPARPIVLLRQKPDAAVAHGGAVAPSVAPGSDWLGIMLPYTPLHHLLVDACGARPLVMTSGNRSDEPIAYRDDDARERLSGIADAFLTHDRPIHRRCEDSVVRAQFPIRRSRGYVPSRLVIPVAAPQSLVAVGAQLKSTFCIAHGDGAYMSAHLGDLDTELAFDAFTADMALYQSMLDVQPGVVAHDLHPEYLSSKWAHEQAGAELVAVQHHHAHAAACMAEHGITEPVLALVFDGTGYGDDGTSWGGELLRCDLLGYERVAHLQPVPMPGADAAAREPWRMAAAYLELAGREVPFERWAQVRGVMAVNAPMSSGMGRLFDAIAAILGVRERVSFEGQAAIELEQLAGDLQAAPYACRVSDGLILGSDLLAAAYDDLQDGRSRAEIAAAFHEGVSAASATAVAMSQPPASRTVVLSGGSFQNLRLRASTTRRLEAAGYRVLSHAVVPPNDAGISYGQAAVAAARLAAT